MTTPRTRAAVSLGAILIGSLALGACVRTPSRPAADRSAVRELRQATIRFDNEALNSVEVYLLDGQREWRLGRVPPGARANLRIPEASITRGLSYLQIAVVTGNGWSPRSAAGDGLATLSMPQPALSMLSQRWVFTDGQVGQMRLRTARLDAGRP